MLICTASVVAAIGVYSRCCTIIVCAPDYQSQANLTGSYGTLRKQSEQAVPAGVAGEGFNKVGKT